MRPKLFPFLLLAVACLAGASLLAQDIPLANWTVPAYRSGAAGGLTPMTDISPAVAFVAMQPCRVVDTRGGGVFTGAYGPPIMFANAIRSFDINSAPHCTGIPPGVEAYSLNFTVTQTAGPSGDIRVWPTGNPPVQVTSVLNWTVTNATLANATIIPAGTNGFIDVQVAGSNTQLLIDINGYFTAQQNAGQFFEVRGSRFGAVILGVNERVDGTAVGVAGSIFTPESPSAGVRGFSLNENGITYGVWGLNASGANDSAGVAGVAGFAPNTAPNAFSKSGVRGESETGYGTIGISAATAVAGFLMHPSKGTILAYGLLGTIFGTDPGGGGPPWAVFAQGNIGADGIKAFLEPHPSDPTKVIQYIALEGPEAGTYFRGRSRFQRGLARIPVPEDFRMVTDPEGLTVQITPIGEMATVAVVRMGLDEIVVKASRDVEFSYLVQGVRASFKDAQPVIRDGTFLPRSADAKLPAHLAERQKRTLIENGTYNADGTANRETARRHGWDQLWEKRGGRPEPRPEP